MKRQVTEQEEISADHISDKGLTPYKELKQLKSKTKTTGFKNGQRTQVDIFLKKTHRRPTDTSDVVQHQSSSGKSSVRDHCPLLHGCPHQACLGISVQVLSNLCFLAPGTRTLSSELHTRLTPSLHCSLLKLHFLVEPRARPSPPQSITPRPSHFVAFSQLSAGPDMRQVDFVLISMESPRGPDVFCLWLQAQD